ncbi:MAG: hypothetical protein ACRDFW_08550, partial [bacterium]
GHANTVRDHIEGLRKFSVHKVRIFNPKGMVRSRYLDLNEFDALVIHYSLFVISDDYLSGHFREQIRQYQGLKLQYIQDEYRWVDQIVEMIRYLGIHVLFTLLSPAEASKIYPETRLPGVLKVQTRAGYVPERLVGLLVPPLAARPIDIGYRGRTLPYWLGQLAQEKVWIAQGMLARAPTYNLRCDIAWAEQDRIYGQRWNRFLMSCKATLGTESGASITDFDGSLERRTKAYLAEHPTADFHEVHREILAPYEGNARVTAISPRIFEAAALRTAMILFPGEYSGIVQPWVHYIPLAKDFSNMDEVVERLRDLQFLREMTERTYHDLVASGRYAQGALTREFATVVSRYGTPNGKRTKVRYYLATLEQPCAVAMQRARVAAEPVLRLPFALIKGSMALLFLLTAGGGRRTVVAYLTDRGLRKNVRFTVLLKDILKLVAVGQARRGALTKPGQFRVAVQFDPDKGRLIFESLPAASTGPIEVDQAATTEARWTDVAALVREGRLRTMVWNHSSLGGNVRYRVAPGVGLTLGVGEYDLHSFDSFVELARRAPEQAAAMLLPLLGVDSRGEHWRPA